jgi:hypothetical protein
MKSVLPILAQLSAPDYLGFAFLLLLAVALMHSLSFRRDHTAEHQHARHPLHGWGHRLHELTSHRHH